MTTAMPAHAGLPQNAALREGAVTVFQCRGLMDNVPKSSGNADADRIFQSSHKLVVYMADSMASAKVLSAEEQARNLEHGRAITRSRDHATISNAINACLQFAHGLAKDIEKAAPK
ncbi:hypothetical protein OK349_14310 [Sphingomonas sp. BT-65]|uniref:hypothetical protein n=1 Tax=Sphingomonas sp. BT-65 TaxID=2989821 RepID=UPI002235E6F3|nr:hypothetical protein [Sphingomonas sp. BT-65]MCW4462888.1 hypothetical protein [Sphingomonas sp. BT-65]